ncbi:MAG: hypothetical protein LC777_21395 [Actinobacteria bacterium]|nr:hypothetical protein [Actinomycetota bacterium]
MPARPVAVVALALAIAAAGCGDPYEHGAGVYTITTRSTATQQPTVPASALPAPAPDGGAAESSEADAPTRNERGGVRDASRAARDFLRGYLPYSYARADAQTISAITPGLRRELARRPPRVPASLTRRARPRLTRLQLSSTAPGAVFLLAHIHDGVSNYVTLVTVTRQHERWLVRRVQ